MRKESFQKMLSLLDTIANYPVQEGTDADYITGYIDGVVASVKVARKHLATTAPYITPESMEAFRKGCEALKEARILRKDNVYTDLALSQDTYSAGGQCSKIVLFEDEALDVMYDALSMVNFGSSRKDLLRRKIMDRLFIAKGAKPIGEGKDNG